MVKNTTFSWFIALLIAFCYANDSFAQVEEVRTDADWMPYFAGCSKEYKPKTSEKRACSDANLAYYLNRNLVFPDSAKAQGIKGTVYVSFVVRANGKVTDIKLLNDIGGGCGAIAKEVVTRMPDWEAAVHKDQNVSVQLTLPIKFEIDEGAEAQKKCKIYWGDLNTDELSILALRTKYVNEKIVVRDDKGELYPVIKLTITYENGKKFRQKSNKGELFTPDMLKIMHRSRPGGTLTISTTLQKKGTFFELHRIFTLAAEE